MISVASVVGRLRTRWLDIAASCAAIFVVLPTCWYRYGIDQALYHYVGAGWLAGRVPYRDAFDIKSPGIYAVYSVAIALFGPGQSSIRILELLGILATAAMVARTVGKNPPDGVFGLSALALAMWNATLFGFWDTAQAEFWESAFVVASYAALLADGHPRRSRGIAGTLAAIATLMKPTAVVALPILAFRAVHTSDGKSRVSALTAFSIGLVVPLLLTVGYFHLVGAGAAFREWIGYVPHYAAAPLDPDWVHWTGPELLLARSGAAIGILLGIWVFAPNLWTISLLTATALGIVLQRRYFSYHAACLGPALVLCAAGGIREVIVTRGRSTAAGAAAILAVGAFLGSPPWTGTEFTTYRSYVLHSFWPLAFGRISRATFDEAFNGPFDYRYTEEVAVSELVESRHPAPTDGLQVRGFDPTIYVLTGLHSPSRFLMETPLENAYLLSYASGWNAEHDRALFGPRAPRFFVTSLGDTDDLSRLEVRGFQPLGSRGRYVVLERGLAQHGATRSEVETVLARRNFEGLMFGTMPARALFREAGTYSFWLGDKVFRGTFHVTDGGEVCIEPELGQPGTCGKIYARGTEFVAFEGNGRELGDFHPSNARAD